MYKRQFKTSVGGQALMEGIMMRGPKLICCAVRKPDGTIETKLDPTPAHGVWMKIPLVRGAIAMIESMIVGYRYMMYSAQVSMGDDYDPAPAGSLSTRRGWGWARPWSHWFHRACGQHSRCFSGPAS